MSYRFLAVASLGLALSAPANAGSNAVNSATTTRAANISLNGMTLYQTTFRATPATVDLPINGYIAIPDFVATVKCKSGVAKCLIVAEVTVQVFGGGSTAGLGLCPTINGDMFDQLGGYGACLFSDILTGFVNHTNVALVSRPPGSKNVMGLLIHPEAAATFQGGNIRYSVYYK